MCAVSHGRTQAEGRRVGTVRDVERGRRAGLGPRYDSVSEFITSPVLSWHLVRRRRHVTEHADLAVIEVVRVGVVRAW
eukprot:701886-Rhodomonas_salina.1